MKYIVIGGIPIKAYTGTTTFLGLQKIGIYDNKKEAEQAVDDNYNECSGLIDIYEVE